MSALKSALIFVAGYHMSWFDLVKLWNFPAAALLAPRTAVMKAASADLSGLDAGIRDDLIQCFYSRIRDRDG